MFIWEMGPVGLLPHRAHEDYTITHKKRFYPCPHVLRAQFTAAVVMIEMQYPRRVRCTGCDIGEQGSGDPKNVS